MGIFMNFKSIIVYRIPITKWNIIVVGYKYLVINLWKNVIIFIERNSPNQCYNNIFSKYKINILFISYVFNIFILR